MKLKQLEIALQDIEVFETPKVCHALSSSTVLAESDLLPQQDLHA
jgi:hypothetical protein